MPWNCEKDCKNAVYNKDAVYWNNVMSKDDILSSIAAPTNMIHCYQALWEVKVLTQNRAEANPDPFQLAFSPHTLLE